MLKERPGIPHYREDVVCFESGYDNRNYPADVAYFNRELYLIFILEGRSEILLNGEHIVMEAGTLLVHGANYLTTICSRRKTSASLPFPFRKPC